MSTDRALTRQDLGEIGQLRELKFVRRTATLPETFYADGIRSKCRLTTMTKRNLYGRGDSPDDFSLIRLTHARSERYRCVFLRRGWNEIGSSNSTVRVGNWIIFLRSDAGLPTRRWA